MASKQPPRLSPAAIEKPSDTSRPRAGRSRSRSPRRNDDSHDYRIRRHQREESSTYINSIPHRSFRRDDKTDKFYNRDRYYRDDRELDRYRYSRDHSRSSSHAWVGGFGTITLRIRTGHTDLPYALPISRIRNYHDLEKTIDSLLHELQQSGDIPGDPSAYAPVPKCWKITDMSGAIISKLFWDVMCKDGASYVLTHCPGMRVTPSHSGQLAMTRDLIPRRDPSGIYKYSTSMGHDVKIKPEPMDESMRCISDDHKTIDNPHHGTFIEQQRREQLAGTLNAVRNTSYPIPQMNRDPRIDHPVRGVVDLNPTHQVQNRPSVTIAIGRPPPTAAAQEAKETPANHSRIPVPPKPCLEKPLPLKKENSPPREQAYFPPRKIRVIVRNPDAGFRGSLTYMYGTKKSLRELPSAGLNWNWDEKQEIDIVLLPVPPVSAAVAHAEEFIRLCIEQQKLRLSPSE